MAQLAGTALAPSEHWPLGCTASLWILAFLSPKVCYFPSHQSSPKKQEILTGVALGGSQPPGDQDTASITPSRHPEALLST